MFERELPPIQTYEARDGRSLCYRHYEANSNKIIILLHGMSEDGQYLHPLAEFISKRQLAQVIVPDLRGYGLHPIRRGDVEYIGQHDDDIEDLVKRIWSRAVSPYTLIIAGHSAGGGNAIRLSLHPLAKEISAFLLLAPAVNPKAPISHQKDPWSTMQIATRKLTLLNVLNRVGLRFLNKWIVMNIDKPLANRNGRETLNLSYRLFKSRSLKARYDRYLRAMTQPTLVLVGEKEEVYIPGQYAPMFAEYNKAKVEMILDCDHDGILTNEEAFREVESWLRA